MKKLVVLTVTILLTLLSCSNQPQKNTILAIGDSNGAIEGGWVDQLRSIRMNDTIINTCVSGNTIGFDNLGRSSLNTLKNIDSYMDRVTTEAGVDYILIMLGTNDCKAVFADSFAVVPGNMRTLLDRIEAHSIYTESQPVIILIAPPPMGQDSMMLEKYHGGSERVASLQDQFKSIAEENKCQYLDVYSRLLPEFDSIIKDGVHFKEEGQMIIAEEISEKIDSLR